MDELAAGLGHRVTTVRLGISWLVAQGKLTIEVEEEGVLVLQPSQQTASPEVSSVEKVLKSTLAETAAYRRFFAEADLEALKRTLG